MWARNRLIEINRLVNVSNWWYVESKNMIADLGIWKGLTVADMGPDSIWMNGFQWMSGNESDFPLISAKLSSSANTNATLCRGGSRLGIWGFIPSQ